MLKNTGRQYRTHTATAKSGASKAGSPLRVERIELSEAERRSLTTRASYINAPDPAGKTAPVQETNSDAK
jgi:hypothetical protein